MHEIKVEVWNGVSKLKKKLVETTMLHCTQVTAGHAIRYIHIEVFARAAPTRANQAIPTTRHQIVCTGTGGRVCTIHTRRVTVLSHRSTSYTFAGVGIIIIIVRTATGADQTTPRTRSRVTAGTCVGCGGLGISIPYRRTVRWTCDTTTAIVVLIVQA